MPPEYAIVDSSWRSWRSAIGVATASGIRQVTQTPLSARSFAAAREGAARSLAPSLRANCAEICAAAGTCERDALHRRDRAEARDVDDVAAAAAVRRLRLVGEQRAAATVPKIAPFAITSRCASTCAAVTRCAAHGISSPAKLSTVSTPPHSRFIASNAADHACGCVTSSARRTRVLHPLALVLHPSAMAPHPSAAAVVSSAPSARSVAHTRWPARSSVAASRRPIPDAQPVSKKRRGVA